MGEGGGQILRSALTISAIANTPVEISRIRSGRAVPGLRPQHFAAVKVLADIFGARVEGLSVGSETLKFEPKGFQKEQVSIDIGSAGSISLVLMTALPAIALSGNRGALQITGGTDVPASPTIDYLRHVVIPAYRMIGIKMELSVDKRGYYPKGGGLVRAQVEPCPDPSSLRLTGDARVAPKIVSVCSELPGHVAQRQVSGALSELEKHGESCSVYTVSVNQALSPGSSVLVYSSSESGVFVGGDALGEIGKKAEVVGREAAQKYLNSCHPFTQVDPHLADMLVVPLNFAPGESAFSCARLTDHLTTNLRLASSLTGRSHGLRGAGPVRVTIGS